MSITRDELSEMQRGGAQVRQKRREMPVSEPVEAPAAAPEIDLTEFKAEVTEAIRGIEAAVRAAPKVKSVFVDNIGTVADQPLKTGAGTIQRLAISDVKNNSVLTLYDSLTASGSIIYSTGTMGANSQPFSVDLTGVAFFTGLTLAITGANCKATIVYE
jgi:nucleoid-associated protein YgaU